MAWLIVEDDPLLRSILQRRAAPRPCRTAGGCREALAAAEQAPPGAVLCDVELGDGDGVALCRRLRELSPGLRVVFMSGSPDALERACASGLGPALLKPFDAEEAFALLETR